MPELDDMAAAAVMCTPLIGVFLCALRFGVSGDGARITAIVFASRLMLFGLVLPVSAGTLAELGMGIAIVGDTPAATICGVVQPPCR